MKTFLVTGGAGFVGSHLCNLILDKGHSVISVDNLVTGSEKNIAPFKKLKNFEFIKKDVTKPFKVGKPVDYIMHLASPASPIDFISLSVEILQVGSFGTYNLLELARQKKAKFLYASSSEVYGDPLEHPQKESYRGNVNTLGERGVYDESKRFSESLTCAFRRRHKMQVAIVRIFNTYGPRMRADDGRVVPNFIKQALSNEPLTVYGDGLQTRSFCYVSDLVNGIYKLCVESDYPLPVNIGNDNEITVLEMARSVIHLAKSKSAIIHKPLPEDDPKLRKPDLSLAREKLGYNPKVTLEEGLQKTVEYFRK
jgi:dTDP-glucose 4,6-dehydratase